MTPEELASKWPGKFEGYEQVDYFPEEPWYCDCGRCERNVSMYEGLIDMLQQARSFAGVPFVITSAIRCVDHNREIGGSPNSAHLIGLAADIATPVAHIRYHVLRGLSLAGFMRIGIHRKFIHVDLDGRKPQNSCWMMY